MNREDLRAVKDRHPIAGILERLGHAPPPGWNGRSDFTIQCPMPSHDDATPSCRIHPDTGTFYCFGCTEHGDIIDLVQQVQGARSFAAALEWITGEQHHASTQPASRPAAAPTFQVSAARTLEINAAAWDALTSPGRAAVADRYLASRGLDLRELHRRIDGPAAGYTFASRDGLSRYLTGLAVTQDELLETGWSIDTPTGLVDRFHRRVLFPLRNQNNDVIGVTGRDLTDHAHAKYLNTRSTAAFSKGECLYAPVLPSTQAVLVVCEGPIDALAIVSRSRSSVGVALCGTAMTSAQAHRIATTPSSALLVAADGDPAGRDAAHRWCVRLRAVGAEPRNLDLPDGADLASLRVAPVLTM